MAVGGEGSEGRRGRRGLGPLGEKRSEGGVTGGAVGFGDSGGDLHEVRPTGLCRRELVEYHLASMKSILSTEKCD